MNNKPLFFGILLVAGVVVLGGLVLSQTDPRILAGCCCGLVLLPMVGLWMLSKNSAPSSGVQWGGK